MDSRSLNGSQPDEVATRDPAAGGSRLRALVLPPAGGLALLPSLLAARPCGGAACCVLVDEVQFFERSEENLAGAAAAAALCPVVCAGLDFTSDREEWPLVAALRAAASAVFTLCALRCRARPVPCAFTASRLPALRQGASTQH